MAAASQRATNFLLIGNPGVGKSTILNCMIGEPHFRSGVNFGEGVTYQLDTYTPQGQPHTYMDTPGLADPKMRKQAAEAITQALRRGGFYKIFFVLTLENGRVRAADITTMRLVLDAAPISSYGIIVNQLPPNIYEDIENNPENLDPPPAQRVMQCVWGGLEDSQRTIHVHFVQRDPQLEGRPDVVKQLPPDLLEFIHSIPGMTIQRDQVTDVKETEYQAVLEQQELRIAEVLRTNERLEDTLAKNKEELISLTQRLEEQDRMFQQELQGYRNQVSSLATELEATKMRNQTVAASIQPAEPSESAAPALPSGGGAEVPEQGGGKVMKKLLKQLKHLTKEFKKVKKQWTKK